MRRLPQRKYYVTRGVGNKVASETMTKEQLEAIEGSQFELILCMVTARMVVTSSSGKRIEYFRQWPRMGRVSLQLIEAILLNSGEYLTPADLAEITGNDNLRENSNVAARIMAIRRTLHDDNETYVQTRKTPKHYAVRWSGRPFIWIERAPNDLADTQDD